MKSLLVITQRIDLDDGPMGFFSGWLEELSRQTKELYVITSGLGRHELPSRIKIFSMGREKGYGSFRRYLMFYWHFFRIIGHVDGIFAHMSPTYPIIAWPALLLRKPIIFWYLHRSVTWRLRLAEKLCSKIVTATKRSLSIESSKIVEVGHGIDVQKFRDQKNWEHISRYEIVSVGRISPIKNLEVLIRAANQLKDVMPMRVRIVGKIGRPQEHGYLESLRNLVGSLHLEHIVEFSGEVSYAELPSIYRQAHITVNLAPPGGLDKVVLESMAAGCLTITSNSAFLPELGQFKDILLVPYQDPNALAVTIQNLIALPPHKKTEIVTALSRTVQNHTIPNVITKIISFF